MKLVASENGKEIEPGALLRVQFGPLAGQAWRMDHITMCDGVARVHCTRAGLPCGIWHREFSAALLGVRVVEDPPAARRAVWQCWARRVRSQTASLLVAGVSAWCCAVALAALVGH